MKKDSIDINDNVEANAESDQIKLWDMYENARSYQAQTQLAINIPKYVNYYEGRQWAAATERTRNFPRPVVNICKFIGRNKKAAILSTPVKVIYTADDGSDTKELNGFVEYIFKEMQQRSVDALAISDAIKKGTYIYHYYWDNEAKGLNGKKEGGLRVELIDVLNFFVANPNDSNEQKQKWILISSREEVTAVQEHAVINGIDPQLITSDTKDSKYLEIEQEGTDYVTVLTRYYKKGGEVYYEKGTKYCLFQPETELKPDLAKAKASLKEDAAEDSLPDKPEQSDPTNDEMFDLYPIVVGTWDERDKSIYGIGEVETLLENQDLINRDLAYFEKARRDMALGGWIVNSDALQGQKISNAADQVIVDHSAAAKGGGQGIKKLPVNSIPNDNLQFVDMFVNLIRTVTGSSEVMSGEVLGKNMSGAAIAQLQSQAEKPLEEARERYFRVKEKQGQVLMCYFKHYYDKTAYNVKETVEGKEQVVKKEFDKSMVVGHKFSVVAEAGAGAAFSELTKIGVLENALQKGDITFKMFIQLAGDKLLGNKEEMLETLNEAEQDQLRQLTIQNQQMQQSLEQAAEVISKQDEVVKKGMQMANEIKRLNTTIIEMSTEYLQAIGQAKAQVDESRGDATLFAQEIAKMKQGQQPPQKETPNKQ